MEIFGYNISIGKKKEERNTMGGIALEYSSLDSYGSSRAMRIGAFYRSVIVNAQSVAQLALNAYSVDSKGRRIKLNGDPIVSMLNRRPDSRMTRYVFFEAAITQMQMFGNAFALINRTPKGAVESLTLIHPTQVQVQCDEYYQNVSYAINTKRGMVNVKPNDILHFSIHSENGVLGKSIVSSAKDTLSIAANASDTAKGFFQNGGNLSGFIKSDKRLTDEAKQGLKESWQKAFSPYTGCPNGVAVLDADVDFKPVSVNPADAQLLESRLFDVQEISRFTGVNPVKLFDFSRSSYSTVEATQLSYLTDTLSPLLESIEQELEFKLFPSNIDLKFDTSALLRTDKQNQASYLTTLVNNGIMTTNEARATLDLPPVEGGDDVNVQVNMTRLTNLDKDENGEE